MTTHQVRSLMRNIILYFGLLMLVGCSSHSPLFPAPPPITPTVHVPQVSNGLIAFTVEQADGSTDVYTMNPDGSNVTQITDDPDNQIAFSWTPDGKRLLFRLEDGLYSMAFDGTDQRPFFTDALVEGESFVWSPDGTKAAFVIRDWGEDLPYIFVINVDGTGGHRLIDAIAMRASFSPSWSPDSSQLVFASVLKEGDKTHIYVANADGSQLRQITNAPAGDNQPFWSPDGTQIFFLRYDPYQYVYVMDFAGNNIRRVLNEPTKNGENTWERIQQFSPDGTYLFIDTIQKDSGSLIMINTKDFSIERVFENDEADWLLWSPDQRLILYSDFVDMKTTRYTLRSADGIQEYPFKKPFDTASGFIWQPVWK